MRRHGIGITGDHHDLDPEIVEPVDSGFGLGPDLVLESDCAENERAVGNDMEDGGAPGFPPLRQVGQIGGRSDLQRAEQVGPADGDGAAPDGGLHPVAGHGPEVVGVWTFDGIGLGPAQDGSGERVFAVGFDRSGQRKESVDVAVDRMEVGDGMAPGGERPGLVEENGVDLAHPLECNAILDEDAISCRDRRRE